MSKNIITPKFRVSYPSVFKTQWNKLSKRDEFSVQALFEKDQDISILIKAFDEVAEEKWGKDKSKWPVLRKPFKNQSARKKKNDEGKDYLPPGYVEDAVYLDFKSTVKPSILDEAKNPIVEESLFYAGCYARASVSVYAYDKAGNRGVNFGLNHLQKWGEGEPLGGRTQAEDDFAPIKPSGEGASTPNDLFN